DSLSIVAHDTGATIARELAIILGSRVRKLVAIGTEIPRHRPPWIQLFQTTTRLPGAAMSFQWMLRSRTFRRSSMGFGGCFTDLDRIEGEFAEAFVEPLIRDSKQIRGQIRYLQGIDWRLVDSLATRHKEIEAATLLVWGEDDPVFPAA